MSIPKTGSRIISVEGVKYRWRIRRKATYLQSDYGIGTLHLAIELAERPGTSIVIFTDRPHPNDWATMQTAPVTPSDVATWILQSLKMGWVPNAKGAPLLLKIEKSTLQRAN
jgi:hypothetical protein